MLRQFITFSGVGAIGTAAHYAMLTVLVELFHIAPVAASACGFLMGAVINYLLNYHFTFKSQAKHGQTLPKFLVLSFTGFCLNSMLMYAGTDWLHVHYLLAQVVATGLVLLWNFSGSRYWIFSR